MTNPKVEPLPSSFRDPAGFLFRADGVLLRQVNAVYQPDFDQLMASGLYAALVDDGLLIPHQEVAVDRALNADEAYKVLQPESVQYISYPYEWCFSQLRDAALHTLKIQQMALDKGMSLKDASAYNIQFHHGRPVFIDTLSFEVYREGDPWVAYRQFCQHFLAPLALMSYVDVGLSQLLRVHIDGIPLPLASRMLPARTRLRLSLYLHLHLHARAQARYQSDQSRAPRTAKVSKIGMLGLIDNLRTAIAKLQWRPAGTEWGEYYSDTNYSGQAMQDKKALLSEFLDRISPRPQWVHDFGGNTGVFSRVAAEKGMLVISQDIDPAAVEKNYRRTRARDETHILPLLLDLTNPSQALGWCHRERMSLLDRGPADAVIALALIHHLAISNNVPLDRVAAFFQQAGRQLIIEFVPKSDSQVQRLLATREDVFPDYTQAGFEAAFSRYFVIEEQAAIRESERVLYRMAAR